MWKIIYSKDSEKFINKNNYSKKHIESLLDKFILKRKGMDINIDCIKLDGKWNNSYRIRDAKIRIIFDIDFACEKIEIYRIGFRGDIYIPLL